MTGAGAGGQRLTVRVYRGTPIAGRFLDKYLDILGSGSAHAAGAFMRDCLLRGFAALESDGLTGALAPTAPVVRHNEQAIGGNTHQNNSDRVLDTNSTDSGYGHDDVTEVVHSADTAGSGVRGMISRLGLGTAHKGKGDE